MRIEILPAREVDLGRRLAEAMDIVCAWIAARAQWINRPSVVTLFLVAMSILIACPDYRRFGPYAEKPWAREALAWKLANPLSPIPVQRFGAHAGPQDAGIIEHLAKRDYRVTVPVIAKLTGLTLQGMDALQQLTSCLFLLVAFLLFRRIFEDVVAAFLGSISVACSFLGQWAFNDFVYFDGIAFFLMILIIWTRSAAAIPFLLIMAGFCDERAILAVPLAYLFQGTRIPGFNYLPTWELLRPNRLQLTTLLSVVAFLALRIALGYHLRKIGDFSGMNLMPVRYNSLVLPLALLLLLKGTVLIVATSAAVLVMLRASSFAFLLALATVPVLLASMFAYDLSRSLAYAFPSIFICATVLRRSVGATALRRIALCSAITSLAMPTYYVLLGIYPLLPAIRLL